MSEQRIITREEVQVEHTWKVEDIYETDEKWEEDYALSFEQMEHLQSYKGRLSQSYQVLKEYLDQYTALAQKMEKLYVYANQRYHQDTGNSFYQDLSDRSSSAMSRFESTVSFMTPEILAIDVAILEQWMEQKEMSAYKKFLQEMTRQREHVLSAELEHMLAETSDMGNAPSDIFSMFDNADIHFDDVINEADERLPLTHGRFLSYLSSSDRVLRKSAFTNTYKAYREHKNTLSAIYRANLKQEWFYAKARKYESSMAMSLDNSNVPIPVYKNLIASVHEHLPLMHRYMKIRKERLGVDELHMYDIYTSMVANVDKKISYEEAKQIVYESLKPLGEEYRSIVKEGFENRWIDVYENQGKRSGAYSWGAYGIHPYVLLNHQENLNSMFTLAHEMGHAMHSYYSDKAQPFLYAGYKTFVAEVASTCNEAILMDYLLKQTTSKEEKDYLINYFMEQFRTTLYRQTMFAEFEMITHEMIQNNQTLTAENLCQIYYDLNVKYYGEDMVIDEEIAMEWARIPHFYTPFYVYQYATGYSAAIAISRKILAGDEKAKEGYFKFLQGGCSMDPIRLLKLCDVDMLTKEPVNSALKLFEELLDQFENNEG